MIDQSDLLPFINHSDVLQHYNIEGVYRGTQFNGLCPIHGESNPSFGMDTETGLWNCLACGRSGNIFQFVQEMENITFKESLAYLAKMFNYKKAKPSLEYSQALLQKLESSPSSKSNKTQSRFMDTFDLPDEFENALDHYNIVSKRVTKEMIKQFDIRYAVDGYYSGCLIIPIIYNGNPMGFFARDMTGEREKSKVYNKDIAISNLFFNWDNAHKNSEYVILTEGIIDCLWVHSYSFNCMALLGINLSEKKRTMLIDIFSRVYICLDNDKKCHNGKPFNPGQKAAHKIGEELKKEIAYGVYNILLPGNRDPDECTKEEFTTRFQNAKRF